MWIRIVCFLLIIFAFQSQARIETLFNETYFAHSSSPDIPVVFTKFVIRCLDDLSCSDYNNLSLLWSDFTIVGSAPTFSVYYNNHNNQTSFFDSVESNTNIAIPPFVASNDYIVSVTVYLHYSQIINLDQQFFGTLTLTFRSLPEHILPDNIISHQIFSNNPSITSKDAVEVHLYKCQRPLIRESFLEFQLSAEANVVFDDISNMHPNYLELRIIGPGHFVLGDDQSSNNSGATTCFINQLPIPVEIDDSTFGTTLKMYPDAASRIIHPVDLFNRYSYLEISCSNHVTVHLAVNESSYEPHFLLKVGHINIIGDSTNLPTNQLLQQPQQQSQQPIFLPTVLENNNDDNTNNNNNTNSDNNSNHSISSSTSTANVQWLPTYFLVGLTFFQCPITPTPRLLGSRALYDQQHHLVLCQATIDLGDACWLNNSSVDIEFGVDGLQLPTDAVQLTTTDVTGALVILPALRMYPEFYQPEENLFPTLYLLPVTATGLSHGPFLTASPDSVHPYNDSQIGSPIVQLTALFSLKRSSQIELPYPLCTVELDIVDNPITSHDDVPQRLLFSLPTYLNAKNAYLNSLLASTGGNTSTQDQLSTTINPSTSSNDIFASLSTPALSSASTHHLTASSTQPTATINSFTTIDVTVKNSHHVHFSCVHIGVLSGFRRFHLNTVTPDISQASHVPCILTLHGASHMPSSLSSSLSSPSSSSSPSSLFDYLTDSILTKNNDVNVIVRLDNATREVVFSDIPINYLDYATGFRLRCPSITIIPETTTNYDVRQDTTMNHISWPIESQESTASILDIDPDIIFVTFFNPNATVYQNVTTNIFMFQIANYSFTPHVTFHYLHWIVIVIGIICGIILTICFGMPLCRVYEGYRDRRRRRQISTTTESLNDSALDYFFFEDSTTAGGQEHSNSPNFSHIPNSRGSINSP